MDSLNLNTTNADAALKSDGLRPELRQVILSLDVDMCRLLPVARVREEPIGTEAQHRRHVTMMDRFGSPRKSVASAAAPGSGRSNGFMLSRGAASAAAVNAKRASCGAGGCSMGVGHSLLTRHRDGWNATDVPAADHSTRIP
jgi:hypothetical protein